MARHANPAEGDQPPLSAERPAEQQEGQGPAWTTKRILPVTLYLDATQESNGLGGRPARRGREGRMGAGRTCKQEGAKGHRSSRCLQLERSHVPVLCLAAITGATATISGETCRSAGGPMPEEAAITSV